jgi:hypothetical protein
MNSAGGFLISSLLMIALLALAIGWLISPFIVLSKFNELLKIERDVLAQLRAMRRYYEPELPPPLLPDIQKPAPSGHRSQLPRQETLRS